MYLVFTLAGVVTFLAFTGAVLGAVTVRQVTEPVIHAEGPHWDDNKSVLYFVDISGHRLYKWAPKTSAVTYVDVGGELGFAIPLNSSGDRFIAGRDHDLIYITWSGRENLTLPHDLLEVIARVDNGADKLRNRFNDAKADASGRLWAGTMGGEADGVLDPRKGTLFSLDTYRTRPDDQVTSVDISNGIAWNRDSTVMYYIDSPTRNIDAFDFRLESGSISGRRTVFRLSALNITGAPDGMTIDTDGNLWVALWGGNSIIKIDPLRTNKLLQQITLPASQVTSVAFGGSSLSTLYVTTSRRGLGKKRLAQQPAAGAVFAVEGLEVRGYKANNVVRDF